MDFVKDHNFGTILKVQELAGGLPDYVRDAQVKTAEDYSKLEAELFADVLDREFPVDTKEATWLSAAYFFGREQPRMHNGRAAAVEDTLLKAAELHGISADVAKVRDAVRTAYAEKTAACADDDYALVVEHNGKTLRRYPVKSAEDVRDGCEYFLRNSTKYPVAWQHTICNNLVKRATAFNVAVPDGVRGLATHNQFPDLNFFLEEVERRKLMLPENCKEAADVVALMTKTALAMKPEDFTPENLNGLAELLFKLDKMAGLDRFYGKRFMPPLSSLYRIPVEKVAAAVDVMDLCGFHVPVKDLMALPIEKYAELFGSEFAQDLTHEKSLDPVKVRAVIPTLPDPDKRALLRVL